MTLTQLTQSRTMKSCSLPVRGLTLVSVRILKMRKSPAGTERTFFHGVIISINDLRYTIDESLGLSRNHAVGSVAFARSFCARTSSFGAYRSIKDMLAPHSS